MRPEDVRRKQARYAQQRILDRQRGIEYIVAVPESVRAALAALLAEGIPAAGVGRAAGLDYHIVQDVIGDSLTRVNRRTLMKLQGVDRRAVYRAAGDFDFLPKVGYLRRVEALRYIGWSAFDLLDHGIDIKSGRRPKPYVFGKTWRRARDVYDELWDQPGPSPKAAAEARRRGFAPPAAWDDDSIDDPTATPDLGEHQYSRSDVAEDVEWLLRTGVGWQAALVRLGRTSDGLDRTLRRAGRGDLVGALKAMDRREAS